MFVLFSECIRKSAYIQGLVRLRKYDAARIAVHELRHDMSHLADAPRNVGYDLGELADALVGHAEAGSPLGVLLMTEQLLPALDRMTGTP
jgi:hypothetical protein